MASPNDDFPSHVTSGFPPQASSTISGTARSGSAAHGSSNPFTSTNRTRDHLPSFDGCFAGVDAALAMTFNSPSLALSPPGYSGRQTPPQARGRIPGRPTPKQTPPRSPQYHQVSDASPVLMGGAVLPGTHSPQRLQFTATDTPLRVHKTPVSAREHQAVFTAASTGADDTFSVRSVSSSSGFGIAGPHAPPLPAPSQIERSPEAPPSAFGISRPSSPPHRGSSVGSNLHVSAVSFAPGTRGGIERNSPPPPGIAISADHHQRRRAGSHDHRGNAERAQLSTAEVLSATAGYAVPADDEASEWPGHDVLEGGSCTFVGGVSLRKGSADGGVAGVDALLALELGLDGDFSYYRPKFASSFLRQRHESQSTLLLFGNSSVDFTSTYRRASSAKRFRGVAAYSATASMAPSRHSSRAHLGHSLDHVLDLSRISSGTR